jgi:hypothetical protein
MPDENLGKPAEKEAYWALNTKWLAAARTCKTNPDAVSCFEAPQAVKAHKAAWAKALLAWLQAGAANAADVKQAELMTGQDALSRSPAEWGAALDDARRVAAESWVREALARLDATYSEPPFGITPSDPDPAAIAEGVPSVSGTESPWREIAAARQACGDGS